MPGYTLSSIIKLYIWKHCYFTCCIRDEHHHVKTVWQIIFVNLDDEDEILLYRYFDGHFGDTYIRMFFTIKLQISIFETSTIICVVQLYSSVNGIIFQHSPYHPFPVGPHKLPDLSPARPPSLQQPYPLSSYSTPCSEQKQYGQLQLKCWTAKYLCSSVALLQFCCRRRSSMRQGMLIEVLKIYKIIYQKACTINYFVLMAEICKIHYL